MLLITRGFTATTLTPGCLKSAGTETQAASSKAGKATAAGARSTALQVVIKEIIAGKATYWLRSTAA